MDVCVEDAYSDPRASAYYHAFWEAVAVSCKRSMTVCLTLLRIVLGGVGSVLFPAGVSVYYHAYWEAVVVSCKRSMTVCWTRVGVCCSKSSTLNPKHSCRGGCR